MIFIEKSVLFLKDLREVFALITNQYDILVAFSDEQKENAHRVRHSIYCKELGFEPENIKQTEVDIFDKISTQLLVFHKKTRMFVGVVRIIHGRSGGGDYKLPMEIISGQKVDVEILKEIKNSDHGYAEISRLGIDKDFRHLGVSHKSGLRAPIRGSIALMALFLGILSYTKITDTKYLFALVEKRLSNSMKKIGIPIRSIGEGVEHRGVRFPIMMDIDEIERIVPFVLWPLYLVIQRRMKKQFGHYVQALDILSDDYEKENTSKTLLASEFNEREVRNKVR